MEAHKHGSEYVFEKRSQADVGGVYSGRWVQVISRWVTAVYRKPALLPGTGY